MSDADLQIRAMVAAQAAEWFVAHRSGELAEAQRKAFVEWLSESPLNAREYLALSGFTQDLEEVAGRCTTPSEELIERAASDLDSVRMLPGARASQRIEPAVRQRAVRWTAWAQTAAAIVLVTLLGTVLGIWRSYSPDTYSTEHAEQRSWRMSDGSTVHLNSDSAVSVKFGNERREVELTRGQAMFQVAKDPLRPFWVRAGDTMVKAVGTEFDVYRLPHATIVSVTEGRVAVWRGTVADTESPMAQGAATPQPAASLAAGQQLRISAGSAVVSDKPTDIRKTVAWLNRQIVFDHDLLGSVVDEFNRYNQIRMRIDDSTLRSAEISGVFNAYDTESFIAFLERQPGMRVERSDREVVIRSGPPSK